MEASQIALGLIARKIADAKSKSAIYSILVNELKPVFLFDQAAIVKQTLWTRQYVQSISGLIEIEHSGPYPVWLRRLAYALPRSGNVETFDSSHSVNPGNWEKFAATYAMSVPLRETYFTNQLLLLFRSKPWDENEKHAANAIGDIAAGALSRPKMRGEAAARKRGRKALFSGAALIGLIAIIPVRLTSISSAETIPSDAFLMAPSFPAVVKRILVSSNETVAKDQVLVELDDADQRAKAQVAQREMEVAEADFRKYSQLSFQDQNSRYRLAEAQGQLQIKRLQLERANLELERTKLRSPVSGIAIVTDPLDWLGKPVQTGERILLISNPEKNNVRIWVPVTDGAILKEGLSGELYLDSDPWTTRRIQIKNWSFEPEMSPQGIMAFRAQATAQNENWPHPLLGLHGVVHLSGNRLPLIFYILRKPLIFMRQTFAI